MTFITVWKQDFLKSERFPAQTVAELMAVGFIKAAWKPNRKGKLKPVLVSLDMPQPKLRGLSAQMPHRVTERAVIDQSAYHQAIVESWFRHGQLQSF